MRHCFVAGSIIQFVLPALRVKRGEFLHRCGFAAGQARPVRQESARQASMAHAHLTGLVHSRVSTARWPRFCTRTRISRGSSQRVMVRGLPSRTSFFPHGKPDEAAAVRELFDDARLDLRARAKQKVAAGPLARIQRQRRERRAAAQPVGEQERALGPIRLRSGHPQRRQQFDGERPFGLPAAPDGRGQRIVQPEFDQHAGGDFCKRRAPSAAAGLARAVALICGLLVWRNCVPSKAASRARRHRRFSSHPRGAAAPGA